MKVRSIRVRGTSVEIAEAGSGPPVLYLHGCYDVHSGQAGLQPFHEALSRSFSLTIPAHPGCGESTGIADITHIEDLAFHYLDLLDALKIQSAMVVGNDLGGWVAAEMAVRDPSRIGRMVLIGAGGLQVRGALNADLFMYSQHRDGGIMAEMRELLFAEPEAQLATATVPDGRVAIPDEVRRYKHITLAGRVGWEPPYFHDPKLARRLHRITAPTLLIWGGNDKLIPVGNGRAYAEHIPNAKLEVIKGGGHAVILEQPETCAGLIATFLAGSDASKTKRAPRVR